MTKTFFGEAKTLVLLFIEETRESASWFKAELLRQYHLSILKEIASTYPETTLYVNKAYEIVDAVLQDCPDFVELTYQYHFAVLRQIGKTYALEEEAEKLTERIKDNDDRGCNFSSPSNWLLDDSAFETEAETDAFNFVEMKQNISDDGLNEQRYPYDNEPSA